MKKYSDRLCQTRLTDPVRLTPRIHLDQDEHQCCLISVRLQFLLNALFFMQTAVDQVTNSDSNALSGGAQQSFRVFRYEMQVR